MKKQTRLLLGLFLLPASLWAATITGTVNSSNPTTPLAGAKVVLVLGTASGVHIDSTLTDTAGSYTFSSVATGIFWLLVSKPGYNTGSSVQLITSSSVTLTANVSVTRNNTAIARFASLEGLHGASMRQTLRGFDLKGSRIEPEHRAGVFVVLK